MVEPYNMPKEMCGITEDQNPTIKHIWNVKST